MNELFDAVLSGGGEDAPALVLLRLCLALLFGAVVAALHRSTRLEQEESSFPRTLVLLSILIAMVTQVIGDSVARAFSLVGALSIVRFRTVVRDTEDTAYVIFAVVVGMAVGAGKVLVGTLGLVVVAIASVSMHHMRKARSATAHAYVVTVRLTIGEDADTVLRSAFAGHVGARQLRGISTASRGLSVDVTYDVNLKADGSIEALVKSLNRTPGVQSVEIQRRDPDAD